MREPIRRHRWVHVAAQARHDVAASCTEASLRIALSTWLGRGLPLVSRALQPHDDPSRHPLGLALPPSEGQRRIALSVAPGDVIRVEEPDALDDIEHVLPPAQRDVALALAARATALGFTLRAFGSAAWQARTGDAYLAPGSDLDLLAAPPSAAALAGWLAALRAHEATSRMRLDGEVERADGSAVNWRELSGGARHLLVKSPAGVHLAPATAGAWP